MIRHTLLPEDEIKSLRREYRIRLIIIFLFFISIAVVIGILSLFPAYLAVYSPDTWALARYDEQQVNKQLISTEEMQKQLARTQMIVQKITVAEDSAGYADMVENILSHRTGKISITSFDLSRSAGTTTSAVAVITGKASSREALINFKKNLEGDTRFKKVELPLSDLAKNRDIKFTLTIK